MKKIISYLIFAVSNIIYSQEYVQTCLKLPDTGQSKSFTNTPGEDSDYLINSPFYIDNGDGTITDTVTGLMWQKTDYGDLTIENASIYVDTMTLGGYTDWRLPSAHEAFTIMNLDVTNPALNKTYFTPSLAEYWWSSTKQYNDASKIWVTNAGGGIGNHLKTECISAGGSKRFYVRAVRNINQPITLSSRFIDNKNGTITDLSTNLTWIKTPTSQTYTWEEALNYAENLSFGSSDEWRLPNIKELESIRNDFTSNPAVDQSIFQIPSTTKKLWSSTSLIIKDNSKSWFWDTQFGITTYELKTVPLNVLCVTNYIPKSTLSISENGVDFVKMNYIPNEAVFNLSFSEIFTGNIEVLDELGRMIFSEKYEGSEKRISTADLQHGSYFIKINSTFGLSKTFNVVIYK